jgi:hypothetical protein
VYVPNDDGFVLVASQGGAPKNHVWYNNLVAYTDVRITPSDEEKEQHHPRLKNSLTDFFSQRTPIRILFKSEVNGA